ncbi:MAG: ATPase [Flavobacteriales bacterium]|nr:ATPase [Flavobacteriales bacterium]
MKKVRIIKSNGERVFFNRKKLFNSLIRSGTTRDLANEITDMVSGSIKEGDSTDQIYKNAFQILKKETLSTAANYSLKKAILELGPTGYPFEKFVGALLNYQGFVTQVGVIVKGYCVNHEIDVVAEKNNEHFMIECKFHSEKGRYCSVKIPLYIRSRFLDVERIWRSQKGHSQKFHQGWIFTNTRFSTDAIQFGECMELKMISWDHPANESLKKRIDDSGLHPITCLTGISMKEKKKILDKNIVLCLELKKNSSVLKEIGLSKDRMHKVLNELNDLCVH